ncbi:MAG: hypothetical protein HY763_03235 [Planctomycetes bacterium]|nr:hypothetical protein [Planctomycetota bacterium]
MLERRFSQEDDGGTRERDEQFTADWALMPVGAETIEIFANDELTIAIIGDLEGQGQLRYMESGTDFSPTLDCPTTSYAGEVMWNANITGTYDYTPVLDTIRIMASATVVSSPEYQLAFTTPGCPEFDSTSPVNYQWTGPGQGVWGFVTIVLRGGVYDEHLDNPLADDRGEEDYFDIHVELGGP